MRLLHTADWHLGRTLHGADLVDAHRAVLDELVAIAGDERPDALIVAGDVFDRAYPPLPAVELFDETVTRLAELALPVVITSGNHDSAIRLGMNARVAEAAGVHIRTRLDSIADPIVVPWRARDGASGSALLYAVPYLDPPSTAPGLEALAPSHAGVIGAAIGRVARDRERRSGHDLAVLVGHGVVTGGTAAREVERPIDVGGVAAVPRELFDDFDYVAMGHLHRPQSLGARVRYSGAPLAFSFDEAGERKSFAMVELLPGAPPGVELLPAPELRPMVRLNGELDALLTDPEHAEAEDAWVEVTLTDRLRPKGAMERLRGRFPHVLKLVHEPTVAAGDGEARRTYGERIKERTELEVAERFLADVRGGVSADAEEQAMLRAAFEAFDREQALR